MTILNQVEKASQDTLNEIFKCIDSQQHFLLEAGAGAGKTYSLIKTLNYLIDKNGNLYQERTQKIACITYTNVAKDEILSRIDSNPIVFCETNHAFCWSLISQFQKQLRELIPQIQEWKTKLEDYSGTICDKNIIYDLGYRSIKENELSLHHDDVIFLTIKLLENSKFRQIISEKYPVILIDEYQDTDKDWIEAIKIQFLCSDISPLFGFFGDHWQKIYGNGCGLIEHKNIIKIDKKINFRSNQLIISSLNKIRESLPQYPKDESLDGSIHIFHTNNWNVTRQTSAHWKGDLSDVDSKTAFEIVKSELSNKGWQFEHEKTRILMLTHKLLANAQGYSELAKVFKYNESFIKKENKYISFFIDKLEPACEAFIQKKYGVMFDILGQKKPLLLNHLDKIKWQEDMNKLIQLRESGTVGDIIRLLQETSKPRLPDYILNKESQLSKLDSSSEEELTSDIRELKNLHSISYLEIIALKKYLDQHSPFQTQHGVKGAEFENVLIVIGRGWNQYNFGEMLKWVKEGIPNGKQDTFERYRNLFYVACSRPKKHLAILFTQELDNSAMDTVGEWFGQANIFALKQE